MGLTYVGTGQDNIMVDSWSPLQIPISRHWKQHIVKMIVNSVHGSVLLLLTLLVGISDGTELLATTTEAGSARAEISKFISNFDVWSMNYEICRSRGLQKILKNAAQLQYDVQIICSYACKRHMRQKPGAKVQITAKLLSFLSRPFCGVIHYFAWWCKFRKFGAALPSSKDHCPSVPGIVSLLKAL